MKKNKLKLFSGTAIVFFVVMTFTVSAEDHAVVWTGDVKNAGAIPPIADAEYSLLYRADGVGEEHFGAYSHHTHIIYHEGRLYAAWTNHLQDEDWPGQRVLMRQSTDLGKTWQPPLSEPPAVLFPSLDDWKKAGDAVTKDNRTGTSNGFAVVDGRLFAINEVLPWGGMQALGCGRLARHINNDGTLGDLFWLEPTRPSTPPGRMDYPDLSDPKFKDVGTKINAFLADKERRNLLTWDFKGKRNTSTEIEPGNAGSPPDGHRLCEPSTSYRTPDGRLVNLWRDLGGRDRKTTPASGRLYLSFSDDGGEHWSIPAPSAIPNCSSRPSAGNLPDGRCFIMTNPVSRQHLILSLSTNGRTFDKHFLVNKEKEKMRFGGKYKGGAAAYQHYCFAGNYCFVIYSVNKEDVEIVRFPLRSLDRL